MPFSLMDMGWNSFFESQLSKDDSQNFTIARVAVEYKNHYIIYSGNAELEASVKTRAHELTRRFPIYG